MSEHEPTCPHCATPLVTGWALACGPDECVEIAMPLMCPNRCWLADEVSDDVIDTVIEAAMAGGLERHRDARGDEW